MNLYKTSVAPITSGKSVSRRLLLQGSAAAVAAPWTLARAAGQVANGKPVTLVVSYAAGGWRRAAALI